MGKALVYFYRPDQLVNHGRTVSIRINRVEYARLTNGAYTMARLDPGRYEFAQRLGNLWVHLPSHTFQMQVNSGEVYFIGFNSDASPGNVLVLGPLVSMSIKMRIEFGPVERVQALEVLKDCHYDEPNPGFDPKPFSNHFYDQ